MHSSSLSVSDNCDVFRGTVNTVKSQLIAMQNATANTTDLNLCYLVFVAAIINSTVLLTMSEESPHEFNAHPAYKAINARIQSAELFCRCFRLQMKIWSAVSWRLHTPVFSATNPSRCYLLEIYADCRIARKMPLQCGAAVCSAKIRKRADTIKHTRDSVRKYHDAWRSFWIAPIGYVDSCIVYTCKHWSDTEHMHTPSIPFNTVELHWHSSCLSLDSSRKRCSKYI